MAQRGKVTVGVAGATGYAGQELVRLLAHHPAVELRAAMGSSASSPQRALPALSRIWDGTVVPLDVPALGRSCTIVFLGLPEDASAEVAPQLLEAGVRVIDLSGAYRLRDDEARARWYPKASVLPEGTVYGLAEQRKDAIAGARLISCPGCYPTAALLALGPIVSRGLVEGDVVVDAKSGISGAGKTPSERTHFSECHGSVSAYGVFGHRHGAEMEQELGRAVTFVPHLVPLDRGILETCYVRVTRGTSDEAVTAAFEEAYADAPFVRLTGRTLPAIKQVAWTNFCDIGWAFDPSSGRLVVVSVLDNLVKGAAGQAVQNMNVVLGLDERTGLLP